MTSEYEGRIRHVTAVLGPTNTGKTHLAIERMLGHASGMIGLPLRLLAREVYDKICARVGAENVALITGEEKIKPDRARYWVSTVEAMPREIDVDFLAIDEIQLAADPERGHVFTDRLLHARGRQETLLLGAQTMRDAIQDLNAGANFISRPRLSKLTYAGQKKITRLPQRSAVVAFSAAEVYSIAELIRRQRGGAAVVLGALSPRTRNAQVALYQSGDVDFIVATDAIGMGLNLDVDHVAFSALRKFDGQVHRNLTPSELAQIAGRAGRHMNDGTFGVTGAAEPLDNDVVERLEQHTFEPVRMLQWRSRDIDFASLDGLRDSLRAIPETPRLTRARMADDVEALETLAADPEVVALARSRAAVMKLWDICQVPDYRKISSSSHAELVGTLYKFLMTGEERIPEDWFARQVNFADRTDGDIDTLANRIAHIRTWTFVSNRADWLKDPAHWQARTREIEDQLSDALHTCLTQRFIDQKTSALMRGMRDKDELSADITEDGAVSVENHYVGRLVGFRFFPESHSDTMEGKAARSAAAQVVSRELGMRARRVAAAKADAFKLRRDGMLLWRNEEIGRIESSEDPLKPTVSLIADEHVSGPDKEKVQSRLDTWLKEHIADKLKPLVELTEAEDVSGLARGIAFQLKESFGILPRQAVAEEMKSLDQPSRAQLRKYGVRFGAFNIFQPLVLKPAPAELSATLWALKHATGSGLDRDKLPDAPRAGLTSVAADPAIPEAFYRAYGYHLCGPRAVRVDILERLADLIRPLLAWRARDGSSDQPPRGSTGDGGFTVTPEMMSILGCSPDELSNVLKSLGFRLERKTMPAPPKPAATARPGTSDAIEIAPVAAADDTPASGMLTGPEADPTGAAQAVSKSVEAQVPPDGSPTPEVVAQAITPESPADTSETATPPDAALAASPSGEDPPIAPEITAQAAQDEASAPAPAEAELVTIDIWRPRRHRSDDRSERPRRGERRGGGRRSDSSNRPGQPAAAPDAAVVATAEAATVVGENGEPGPERAEPRRDTHRRAGDRRQDRAGAGRGDERKADQGRPRETGDRNRDRDGGRQRPGREGGGRDRRDDRKREERRPLEMSAAPRRGKTADPDSPFAALGALREALAKREVEKKNS
ncbi:MAG: helicase-related protein [Hyphomicrobiaceae bacterium]|nr:helicase-related protein [Hyphomicrobiaceae bacterium]